VILTIHRGTREIGGTCIELVQGNFRIILDIGIPLVTADGSRFDLRNYVAFGGPELVAQRILPQVAGLYQWDTATPPVDALFLSHPHLDHYGFVRHVRENVPVFIGEKAYRVLDVSTRFLGQAELTGTVRHYFSGKSVQVGPFSITPFLMDHSAFDAYSFVIEAGGRIVIYTGDFREHGRKSKAYEFFLKNAPRHADALLMEGSLLGRDGVQTTEVDVERRMTEVIQNSEGMAFFVGSAQNIDRLVSLYKACRKAGRILAVDLYTASLLRELGSDTGIMYPSANFPDLRVFFFPVTLRRKVKKEHLRDFQRFAVRRDDLVRAPLRYCMLLRANMIRYLDQFTTIDNGTLIYSMWRGYLEVSSMKPIREFSKRHQLSWHDLHTSGHATIATLKKTVTALAPQRLIPVHTFHPAAYQKLFSDSPVTRLQDGECLEI
jgi:ribonuclease J